MTSDDHGADPDPSAPPEKPENPPTATPPAATKLTDPKVWVPPIVVVTLVMALLAGMYLASILNPEKNLHGFPIALVNQDEGEGSKNYGNQITDGLIASIPSDQIDVRQIGIASAESQLAKGEVYGAIIIPSDFSKILSNLAIASATNAPGDIDKPLITVRTNPRAGPAAASIVQQIFASAMEQVNKNVGQQLSTELSKSLPPGDQLSAVTKLVVDNPINVVYSPFDPLPANGAAGGISAFYYALLLLLAGFTGAMIVNSIVDGRLGFVSVEFGPWSIYNPSAQVSRFHTLLIKWLIMIGIAVLVSGVYVAIGAALDMPIDRVAALYGFGAFAIAAVGITSISVLAAFGSAGLLINLILFVILGIPSSGGTVPLEGQPVFFEWLAKFEPLHQVFVGVRAILYFDARYDSGLAHSFIMTLFGLAVGVVLGIVATKMYDRKGLTRAAAAR